MKCVPIPVSTFRCNRSNGGCCSRSNMPLTLAYARTIHKFQGLSAGPVDEGKIPNPYDCIVCDPDINQVEGRALGLLYTAISRATTFGDANGLNSAIYFDESFNAERIRMLGKKINTDEDFQNVTKRRVWVAHIKQSTKTSSLNDIQTAHIKHWIDTSTYSYNTLFHKIENYKQHRCSVNIPKQRKRKRT